MIRQLLLTFWAATVLMTFFDKVKKPEQTEQKQKPQLCLSQRELTNVDPKAFYIQASEATRRQEHKSLIQNELDIMAK